ncbi:MAG TPA: hypothetical protein G4O15_02900 [Dehalococcoidia bacterium]|nr:hypothetical protein [Dehalococcoidia bacterium]
MSKNQLTLKVLNPRSRVEIDQVPNAPRIKDLTGKKIVVLSNMGNELLTYIEEAMKNRIRDIQFQKWEWPRLRAGETFREPNLDDYKNIAENSDGVVVLLGISGGSTPRAVLNAAKIEKFGTPAVVIVGRCFQQIARFFARSEGLPDIALGTLPMDYVPTEEDIEELKIREKLADEIIEGMTRWSPQPPKIEVVVEETLEFSGEDYPEAQWNMENFFCSIAGVMGCHWYLLQKRWLTGCLKGPSYFVIM